MIDIIKPSTILTVFSNVYIFMYMQLLLFWYKISKTVENILVDKAQIVKDIIQNSKILKTKLNTYVQSEEYQRIYNQSLIDKQARIEFNLKLTWQWMFIPFLIITIILIIGVIYAVYVHRYTQYNTLKLDKTDMINLATVFLGFLTETIFIFVLVMRYIYISDIDMIIFFINSEFGKDIIMSIPSLLPLLIEYGSYAPYGSYASYAPYMPYGP